MTAGAPNRPSVSVVMATRDRPLLLVRAVRAVLAQRYAADVEVLAVFDQVEPDLSLVDSVTAAHPDEPSLDGPARTVRVLRNERTPGLPGARNTGILAANAELIAFCDDDDVWLEGKLERQVAAMAELGCRAAVTEIQVRYGDELKVRSFAADRITLPDLVRDRVAGAHPSTYLAERAFVLEQVGLVDEEIPGGYGEDYDWLLRVARHTDIAAVAAPLVEVLWHRGSYFTRRWETIVDALQYVVDKHPEIRADRRGLARIQGQQAFALAALGRRADAWRKVRETAAGNPAERRLLVTVPVLLGLVRAEWVLHALNRVGRGI